jgi:hypothetical protein
VTWWRHLPGLRNNSHNGLRGHDAHPLASDNLNLASIGAVILERC